ncbi:MAG: DUF3261 domain-containing protein [Spirochaetaceae bacterium]|nr:DUF3261 domain-containing protein [Spirochaetaceae bacterium]
MIGISCTSTPRNIETEKQVYLTDTTYVNILPPSVATVNLQMFQQVVGSYSGQNFQMDAFLILNQDEINVTLMNSFGTTMGTLLYTPSTMEFETALFPASIKPAYIIFDFQLCFYPVEELKRELEDSGLSLNLTKDDSQELREIRDKDRLIISILKENEKIQYVNNERNYSYTIYGDFNGT